MGRRRTVTGAAFALAFVAAAVLSLAVPSPRYVQAADPPGLWVSKGASIVADGAFEPHVYPIIGDPVYYRIRMENTGAVALTGVTLVDSKVDLSAMGCHAPTELAVGDAFQCDYSVTAKAGTVDNGVTANSDQSGPAVAGAIYEGQPRPTTPALTVAKTTNAPKALYNPPTGPNVIVSTADEGDTITYKLTYTVHGVLSYPIIEDVIPAGLTYVDNSATHSDDLYPTDGYDPTTRTLTWIAPPHLNLGSVSTSGSVTYKVKVDAGAAGRPQPLTNTATVHSDTTGPETAMHLLFVGALPDSVTALPTGPLPTAPGTDIEASGPAAPVAPNAGGWLVVVGSMVVAISIALVGRSRRERHR